MFGGGFAKSVRDWWENVPDLHGDIRIYTRDEDWVEFRIRFTDGTVRDMVENSARQVAVRRTNPICDRVAGDSGESPAILLQVSAPEHRPDRLLILGDQIVEIGVV